MIKEWFFIDATSNNQQGPVTTETVQKMMYKNSGYNASTMIWRNGQEAWKTISEVEEFKTIVKLLDMQWFYVDSNDGKQKGPVSSRFFKLTYIFYMYQIKFYLKYCTNIKTNCRKYERRYD